MPLESAEYVAQLNTLYPTGADPRAQGDDHIRLLKRALKQTFPNLTGAVIRTAAQINAAPYDKPSLEALLGGNLVTGRGDFSFNGVPMQNPPPNISLGFNKSASKVHVAIDSSFVSGPILTEQEFTGSNQTVTFDAANGHQRFPGGFELQWMKLSLSYTNGVATFSGKFPRGFDHIISGWVAIRATSLYQYYHPLFSIGDPNSKDTFAIRVQTVQGLTGTQSVTVFAIGYRKNPT